MRIDSELCQKILVAVESDPDAGSGRGVNLALDGYEPDVIGHHVKYLVDTKMLKAIEATHMQSPYPEFIVTEITPEGRAHLDANEPEAPRNRMGF